MDQLGYIHNISTTKSSKRGNIKYFNFGIQTDNEEFQRAVCFHIPFRDVLTVFQQSGNPVKLRNISRKANFSNPEVMDIIVNKRCKIQEASNSDVRFEQTKPPENNEGQLNTVEETLTLEYDTVLKIKGRLCLDRTRIEDIQHLGNNLKLLNAASLTDNSGSIKISLWDDCTELENERCYFFQNVKLKENRDGTNRLTTTPNTTTELIDDIYPIPDVQIWAELITVQIPYIDMATTYTTVFLCLNCKKNLTELNSMSTVKCNQCHAVMRISRCHQVASIRLGIRNDANGDGILWLTAFDEQLSSFLTLAKSQHPELNVELFTSSEEEICEALLSLTNVIIQYDKEKSTIVRVSSEEGH